MKTEQKLTISHIQHYLAYGLKVQWFTGRVETVNFHRIPTAILTNSKPLLLPLSALYEEIDGEIGIVELAKMSLNWAWKLDRYEGQTIARSSSSIFFYNDVYQLFEIHTSDGKYVAFNQLALFDYLFSHHYDVFDLCSKGLAIDKRSVK